MFSLCLGWRLLWNCRGCKYPPQAQHSRFFPHQCLGFGFKIWPKICKESGLESQKSKFLAKLEAFPSNFPKTARVINASKPSPLQLRKSASTHQYGTSTGKNGITKGLTANPKVQMFHHANLFLKYQFGIIPYSSCKKEEVLLNYIIPNVSPPAFPVDEPQWKWAQWLHHVPKDHQEGGFLDLSGGHWLFGWCCSAWEFSPIKNNEIGSPNKLREIHQHTLWSLTSQQVPDSAWSRTLQVQPSSTKIIWFSFWCSKSNLKKKSYISPGGAKPSAPNPHPTLNSLVHSLRPLVTRKVTTSVVNSHCPR